MIVSMKKFTSGGMEQTGDSKNVSISGQSKNMTVPSNPIGHTTAIQNRLCNHNELDRLKIFFHESL